MVAIHYFISSLFFVFCLFSLSLSNSDFNALLSFKASVSDPNNSLSSWLNSTQPCTHPWFGVTCNPSTHRVIKLVLENLNLTGPVQPLSQLSQLRLLSLKNNSLYSLNNLNLSSCPHLKNIYLSHNRFRGIFPSGVSNIRRLHRLDLSYNFFTGEIPMTELARLPSLLTLRLEANSFTGTLDTADSISLSLTDFNISKNKLSGEIPSWMSRFPVSSFGGNENLCGRPLASDCSNRTAESEASRSSSRRLRDIIVLVIVLFDVVAIVAAVVTITWCCYKRKRNRRGGGGFRNETEMKPGTHHNGRYGGEQEAEMVLFEGCQKGFTKVGDLLKASAELLGKGCVGTTYKVVMEGGDVVVKRIRERKKKKEVEEWVNVIGGLRHCNIVNLRAYCNTKDELLLVYDFLPNGSLHALLHGIC